MFLHKQETGSPSTPPFESIRKAYIAQSYKIADKPRSIFSPNILIPKSTCTHPLSPPFQKGFTNAKENKIASLHNFSLFSTFNLTLFH